MKQTYHLSWEIIQEFRLPKHCSCSSVDVNEALGEIMFACRNNGLVHYKMNTHSGLVMATKQPHRVTNYARNCRLVTCCSDGSYLVLNHRQLRYVRLTSNRMQHALQQDAGTSTNRTGSLYAGDSLTAYSRSVSQDFIESVEQAVGVGDVRSMVADKQAESVFLLYADRLTRNSLANLTETFVIDRCFSLTTELFNIRLSRQFMYMMNSIGDIMVCHLLIPLKYKEHFNVLVRARTVFYFTNNAIYGVPKLKQSVLFFTLTRIKLRYRSECYDKRDQLYWRTIGSRVFPTPAVVDRQAAVNRRICRSRNKYLLLLDSESPVGSLGFTIDPSRQIAFAATGGPAIYALWHPDPEPDLSLAGWGQNWLEDMRMCLADARGGRICRGSSSSITPEEIAAMERGVEDNFFTDSFTSEDSVTASYTDVPAEGDPMIPGPLACLTSTSSRSGYLYVVDATAGNKVCVLRYSTETARID